MLPALFSAVAQVNNPWGLAAVCVVALLVFLLRR